MGHARRIGRRTRRRPVHRSRRQPGRAGGHRSRPGDDRVSDEPRRFVRGTGAGRDIDARARAKCAVGGQHRDGGAMVRSPCRYGHGDLQRRAEYRIHDRVPGCRHRRSVARMANSMVCRRRCHSRRPASPRVAAGAPQPGVDRSSSRRREPGTRNGNPRNQNPRNQNPGNQNHQEPEP